MATRLLHDCSTDCSTLKRRLTGTKTALSQLRSSEQAHLAAQLKGVSFSS